MSDTLLTVQERKKFHSSSRLLMQKNKEERAYRKQLADMLLNGGMPSEISRSILNNGYLFSHEDRMACEILEKELIRVYAECHSYDAYQEPVSLECLYFIFQILSMEIPLSLHELVNEMIMKRYAAEEDVYKSLHERNSKSIQKRIDKSASLRESIRFHYPVAIFGFLSVLLGIIILFIGFDKWTYPEILIGLSLLSPVFFLRESRKSFIQFRTDVDIEKEIQKLEKQIFVLRTRLQKQQNKMSKLKELLFAPQMEDKTGY